jgi:hypothetical protein
MTSGSKPAHVLPRDGRIDYKTLRALLLTASDLGVSPQIEVLSSELFRAVTILKTNAVTETHLDARPVVLVAPRTTHAVAPSRLTVIRGTFPISTTARDPHEEVQRIFLHYIAAPTARSAVESLLSRGLGYHYLVDRDGTVLELVPPELRTSLEWGWNRGTIGICLVGGGDFGDATPQQYGRVVQLVRRLRERFPELCYIAGHPHEGLALRENSSLIHRVSEEGGLLEIPTS